MQGETQLQLRRRRLNDLAQEAQDFEVSFKELSTYINPKRGEFGEARVRRGQMINHKILLDDHATHSCRILASGLNSGITSKSRPWFRLTLADHDQEDLPGVRLWLDEVQRRMYLVLEKSNMYSIFQSAYEELGTFGTACYVMLPDFTDVIRGRSFTAGQYYLGTDEKGRVNCFGRKYYMKVVQMVDEFGVENCSPQVRADFENNKPDNYYQVSHLIEPNDKRNPAYKDRLNMPFRSCYWETNGSEEKFLAKRGFQIFPVVAPRWETITTDTVYGYGPGWYALGNIKQLQKTVKDKLLAQEKAHNPPMQEDASIEGASSYIPGGITKSSSTVPNAGVRPAYQITGNLESLIESITTLKDSIDRSYYVNLFMMLAGLDGKGRTATEIAERQQEKIMMMGPILHKLDEEMLTQTLELEFHYISQAGGFPPPPQNIAGSEIKIQYISILAQAQKALGVTQVERVLGIVGGISGLYPEAPDNFNIDETVRGIAEMEGIPAKFMSNRDDMAQLREHRAKMEQAAQAAQYAGSAADTTKKLADSPMDQNSALDKLVAGVPQ